MPTSVLPTLPDAPRPPWRVLALLTAVVVIVHLVLLGLAPSGVGTPPSPLADRFITRTIVVAPPPAAAPAPPAAPAPVAEIKPIRPRPPARPRAVAPTPTPAAEPTAPPEPQSQDLTAQSNTDTGTTDTSPASAGDAGSATENGQATAAAANEAAAANMPGSVPLRIPGSVRLAFAATAQQGTTPMQGVFGNLVWLQDGERYDAQLSLTFLFKTIRSQHSNGVIGSTGIEPLRFSDKRKTEVASHFVRDQKTVIFSNNSPSVPLLAGAQDRLSVVMQLGALMAGDPPRYPPESVIAVQTVGPSDAEIWTFTVSGEERLTVPAGEFTVRKLTRNPRQPFDDKIELWLAPELGYLPVRIKQTLANQDFVDLQLREQVPLRTSN
jgi:Protein of unknown function (DUF3108)